MTDPDDTLIIVTADDSHVFTISGYPSRGNPILGKVKSVPQRDGDPLVEDKDLLGLPYTTLSYANGPGNTRHVPLAQREHSAGGGREDLSAHPTVVR